MLCCVVPCRALLCCAVLCCAVLWCAVLCRAVLCCAVPSFCCSLEWVCRLSSQVTPHPSSQPLKGEGEDQGEGVVVGTGTIPSGGKGS